MKKSTIPKSDPSVKFTPGPWKYVRVKEDIDTFAIRTETDDTLAAVGISPVGWRPGKDIANAALIAAAPEMFTALMEVLNWYNAFTPHATGRMFVPDDMIEKVLKALQKARGEQ